MKFAFVQVSFSVCGQGIVNGLAMRDLLDLFGTRYANGVSNVMSEYWDSIRRSDNALEVLVLLLLFIPVFILVGVLGVGVAFVSAVFTVLVKYGILPEVPVYQLSLFALGLLCVYLVYLWVTGYFQVSDKGFFASQRDAAADGIVTVAVTVVGVLVLGAVGIANRMRR
ncbi:MAG: hypothetical protein P4L87_02900 [Formivibrio sp.]|nr:hypothetical protein [Formivibrio sp.]